MMSYMHMCMRRLSVQWRTEREEALMEQLEVLSRGAKDRRQYGLEIGLVQAALSASGGFSTGSIPSTSLTLTDPSGSLQSTGDGATLYICSNKHDHNVML